MRKHSLINIGIYIILPLILCTVCHCEEAYSVEDAITESEKIREFLSFDKIFDLITGNIFTFFKSVSANTSLSVCIILISSVMTSFKEHFKSCHGIFDIITESSLILSLLPTMIICCQNAEKTIVSLCGYMTAFIPAGCALLTSSGNPVSAASSSLYGAFMINTVQLISVSLILPCIKAIFSITAVNTLCKNASLSGITSFFKSCCLWIMGISFTVLTGIYSLQTLLSSYTDNLALRGLRFSAAKLIPIAGGMISESMKTVITSIGYIKSVSGIGAIVFTVYTLALPFCTIICTKLILALLSALSGAVKLDGASKLFDGFSSHLNILSALLTGCAVSFIIVLAMFINVSVTV